MKRLVLLSLLLFPIFLFAQYPTFSNKQKLGVQTTGDGLIFRGTTVGNIPTYTPSNVNNAYFHLDTTNNKLYLYNGGWQQLYPAPQFDTTTLNVYLKISDTTAMLLPYFRDSDTTSLNLINRFALKLNISDTSVMLSPYLRKADTISLSNRINLKFNTSDTTILSNRITTNANNIIVINNKLNTKLDTIYKKLKNVVTRVLNKDTLDLGGSLTEGYGINIIGDSINVDTTIIFTQSDTITLSNRIDNKLNISDTVSLSNRINLKLNKTDTINLSNRIDLKLNPTDTISLSNRIDIKLNPSDTVSLSNRINTKLNSSDTISLSNRINKKLDTLYVNYQTNVDLLTNKDTININTLEAGAGINIVNNVISLDTTLLDSVVRIQNVYVKNGTGTVLNKGEAVYVTGAAGTNILVGRASNVTESSSSKTIGLTMTSIGVNGFGYVIKEGLLKGLNTNSATAGDPIWLGVNGALIFGLANKPFAPKHLVYLGVVTDKNPSVGEVYVTVQNGFEIKELHDVQIIDPVNKASLYYNLSESLWRDTTATLLVSDTTSMLSKYVNTYGNQTEINGDKTFNNVVTIDSATVTGKLLVNTNISDAVKINSNTNSTNLELMNNGGSVFIKSSNKNMTLQTDTTALVYLKGDVNKVGILTMNPQQALEVAGTIRVDSLGNNLIPVKLVGGSNANDLTNVELGTGLSFVNDTLKIADNIINSGDTATLLRKDYLGIDSNVLVWTEGNKKLLPYFTQVYRNGQLLKYENQYTITSDSILTLAVGSFRLKDNITIIAIDNITALAGSGGVISLQGNVSGSGTNTINTTINNGVVTNTMLAGGISNDKLDVISTAGKVINSATTATNSNTVNAIVSRNASGDFSARNITATNFYGNATSAGYAYSLVSVTGGPSALVNFSINTVSLNGVRTVTIPDNNVTMATTNLSQTFGGTQTFSGTAVFSNQITGSISGSSSSVANALTINAPLTGTSYNGSSAVSIGLQAATTSVAGSMSAADKTKLDGIASGATANIGTVTSVSGTGTVSGLTLTGTVSTTGNLTLGGTLSLTSGNVTSALGFTPYNATNPNSYITSLALSPYATLASPTFTGTVNGITKSMVGLGNVDNTTDAGKPVSTATQTALNLKQNTLSNASTTVNGILTAANFNIFNDKQNALNGTGFVKASGTTISYDNTSYLPLTGGTLSGKLSVLDSISIGSLSQYTGRFTRYLKATNVSPYIDLFIGSVGTIGTWAGRMHFQTSYNTENPTTAMTINEFGNINMNGTLGVTGATTFNNTSTFVGNVAINTTTAYKPLEVYANANDFVSVGVRALGLTQYSGIHFGYVEPNTDYRKSAIVFQRRDYTGGFDASGSIHLLNVTQGQGGRSADLRDARLTIMNNGNVGINDTLPSFTLDVTGTLGISGAVTLSTTSASPNTLLGKNTSTNVVGTVTTLAETGLMTRGVTTFTTSGSVAIFDVTHNLGTEPVVAIVTPNAINGNTKIFYEIIGKDSTMFRVQAFNVADGSLATNKTVSVYWMAIK